MQTELEKALRGVSLDIWDEDGPCLGKAYGYRSRTATYRAAAKGHIPAIRKGKHWVGLCAPARRELGLEESIAA